MHRIFVYGTLMRGESNHRLLEKSKYLGPATTQPKFKLVNLGSFPGMEPGGRTAVIGEVFEVDDSTLHKLDLLEGHPRMYLRTPIQLVGCKVVEAEAYIWNLGRRADYYGTIKTGNWRQWRNERRAS